MKTPLNSKLLDNTDCLHWIWAVKIKRLLFLLPFYSCAHVVLYFIAANKSVLVLYACAHKISLKYLFPEKIAIEICCQN